MNDKVKIDERSEDESNQMEGILPTSGCWSCSVNWSNTYTVLNWSWALIWLLEEIEFLELSRRKEKKQRGEGGCGLGSNVKTSDFLCTHSFFFRFTLVALSTRRSTIEGRCEHQMSSSNDCSKVRESSDHTLISSSENQKAKGDGENVPRSRLFSPNHFLSLDLLA